MTAGIYDGTETALTLNPSLKGIYLSEWKDVRCIIDQLTTYTKQIVNFFGFPS